MSSVIASNIFKSQINKLHFFLKLMVFSVLDICNRLKNILFEFCVLLPKAPELSSHDFLTPRNL